MSGTLTESRPAPRRAGQAARLTLVLQANRPRSPALRLSLEGVDEVRVGRGDARRWRRTGEGAGAVLGVLAADPRMSEQHCRLTRLGGRWLLEDRGSKNGTRVDGAVETRVFLEDGDLIEAGQTFFLFRDEAAPDAADPGDLDAATLAPAAEGLATLVPALARAFERLAAIAPTTVPVALTGETGTGKELVARALHALSGRSGRFVAINCGALPATLVEGELFGARKGAFTGAAEDRPGLVRASDKGTLLLDEIADLPASSQAALLRVLQEREVTPLGTTAPVPVDLRPVAATRHDLAPLVADGRFREDLWARLAGFRFALPPLRERREDLGLLVAALLRRLRGDRADAVTLSADAARALCLYDWPRNVRELELALHGALALAADGPIDLPHLPPELRTPHAPEPGEGPEGSEADTARREELIALIRKHGGNLAAVARELRKDRKQIQRWVQRFGIDPDRYRI